MGESLRLWVHISPECGTTLYIPSKVLFNDIRCFVKRQSLNADPCSSHAESSRVGFANRNAKVNFQHAPKERDQVSAVTIHPIRVLFRRFTRLKTSDHLQRMHQAWFV